MYTKNVEYINSKFSRSKWNTNNVNNMSSMFSGCSSLIYLPNIYKWNTNNVKNMESMFLECS